MDVFQKMYSTYYNVMCFTGLWPDDYTLITKVRRVGFCLLTLCCIGAQVSTLRMVEITLYNLLQTLSFTFPMLLFFLRYVGFVITLPSVKHFLENFGHDYDAVKDPIEADLFMKQAIEARRVVMLLLVISSGGMMLSIFLLLIPTIMQSKLQTRYLNMVGFFYTEVTQDSNVVTLQLIIVICLGLLSITCTESSLAVFVAYLCGLLEIARYRIRTAVDEMACSGTVSSNIINIRSAMDLHRRAVEKDLGRLLEGCDVVLFIGDHNGRRLVRHKYISPIPGGRGLQEQGKHFGLCTNYSGTFHHYIFKQL
ncbi:uncharacterized protein LOC143259625 isoform X2 [Megalopta genalis]|uniref:uncharacterized protein LOC143259625 isoform X2 n=1 Tax=Megalopta genalis TaxID=115081 RepID=UPI003FD48387